VLYLSFTDGEHSRLAHSVAAGKPRLLEPVVAAVVGVADLKSAAQSPPVDAASYRQAWSRPEQACREAGKE
jgi:hypothetical protein